jgi:hypothetical protein
MKKYGIYRPHLTKWHSRELRLWIMQAALESYHYLILFHNDVASLYS